MDDLVNRLRALVVDCSLTDGWECAAIDVQSAADRIEELERERAMLLADIVSLTHMVKDADARRRRITQEGKE